VCLSHTIDFLTPTFAWLLTFGSSSILTLVGTGEKKRKKEVKWCTQQVPNKYPTSAQQVPNKCPTSTQQVPNKYPTSTQQVPNKCPTSTQQVPNKYPTSTQQVPNKYPTSTQHVHRLPCDSSAMIRFQKNFSIGA